MFENCLKNNCKNVKNGFENQDFLTIFWENLTKSGISAILCLETALIEAA